MQVLRKLFFEKKGQALVEFALVAPIFILIFFVGIIQFGILINYEMGISSAAREGARWGSITTYDATSASNDEAVNAVLGAAIERGESYMERFMGWELEGEGGVENGACLADWIDHHGTVEDNIEGRPDGGDEVTVECWYKPPIIFPIPNVFDKNNPIVLHHRVFAIMEDV
ncbi:MAG: TadE/TadG family type IV pilus assembly protein [bacterium]